MSRVFAFLFAVAVVLPFGASAQADALGPRDGWRVVATAHPFPELVDRLRQAIKDERMGLVTQASASDGAKAQGIVIPGNRVLGVYRNDYARRMLAASVAAGIEAPIRFYVTENADGSATLSWKTPSTVFAPYTDEGGDGLRQLATELDGVFEAIAERAVAE